MQPAPQQHPSRIVQSRQNSRVKELRACLSLGQRSASGRVAVEGEHLLAEAVRSGVPIQTVFFRTGSRALLERVGLEPQATLDAGIDIIELPPELFAGALTTEAPQGIAALVAPRIFSLEDTLRGEPSLIVLAAGLQDPGNLGTVIRSAEAFGATGVIALPGTVSQWNAKVMRASAGSVLRLPVVAAREDEVFALLRSRGVRLLASMADGGRSPAACDLALPTAILVGNEGSGLPRAMTERADAAITIPCPGPVESLNAAVAYRVLLYEAARQRASK